MDQRSFVIGKKEAKKSVEEFLNRRNIAYEFVLGYFCFEHEGKHHRVKTVMEAKKKLGVPL